jgi:hypothetical protein
MDQKKMNQKSDYPVQKQRSSCQGESRQLLRCFSKVNREVRLCGSAEDLKKDHQKNCIDKNTVKELI